MKQLLPIAFALITPVASATVIEIDFTGKTFSVEDLTGHVLNGNPEDSNKPVKVSGSFALDTDLLTTPTIGTNGTIGFGSAGIPIPSMTASFTIRGQTFDPFSYWTGTQNSEDAFISNTPPAMGDLNVIGAARSTLDPVANGVSVYSLAALAIDFLDTPDFITALLNGSAYKWAGDSGEGSFQLTQRAMSDTNDLWLENALVQFSLESVSINRHALVPEPSALPLLAAGLAGIVLVRRRKA